MWINSYASLKWCYACHIEISQVSPVIIGITRDLNFSHDQLVKAAETVRDMKGDGSHAEVMLHFRKKPEELVYKIKLKSSLCRGRHRWRKGSRRSLRLPLKKTGAPEIYPAAYFLRSLFFNVSTRPPEPQGRKDGQYAYFEESEVYGGMRNEQKSGNADH